eukprot:m.88814 g.88814  ORF g.88814 m.88814 type:complete len:404 (-) comp14551_c1_seq2:286-1497(-)
MSNQSTSEASTAALGHACRSLFMLEDGYINLNHGSFGTVPHAVMEAHIDHLRRQEARPDVWFRGQYQELVLKSRTALAEYLHAPLDSVCLVESTSNAVNACFRATCASPSDHVLLLDCVYPMVRNTVTALQSVGLCGECVDTPVTWPILHENQVLEAVKNVLEQYGHGHFKVALFSHIVSFPAVILPILALTKLCKEYGVQRVIIDGAHCPGQLLLDVSAYLEAGVDAYIGNCHKWLFTPKGTAVMCLAPGYTVYPTVISSEWHNHRNNAVDQYTYTGTRDYTPFCSISHGLAFHQQLGGSSLMQRNREMAAWAGKYLADLFGTETASPEEMTPSMCTVRLPCAKPEVVAGLYDFMMDKHKTVVAAKVVKGTGWVRLSMQAYVEKTDVEQCAQHILEYLKQQS